MRLWRGLVVLAVVLVITAACNGSSDQREALLRLNAGNSADGGEGVAPSGSATADQTGALPSEAGAAAPEQSSPGSPVGGGSSAAPSAGAAPGAKTPTSGGSRAGS